MDALTLLRNDHQTVEQLFKRFEKAGDSALGEKRLVVDRIIEELSIHAAIEEQIFYPVARATVPATEDIALESLEEHHIVKWVLNELADMEPGHERFDAKVTVLMENVRHHVQEEQNEFFPKVRNALSRSALNDLGDALAQAKRTAPNSPHPRSPDSPPGNSVVGTIAGVVDRVGDNISGIAQGSVTAVQDLIARILGNSKPDTSPTGSTAARSRATGVRKAASRATGATKSTTKSAKSGSRTAKKSVRKSATTAKKAASSTRRSTRSAAKKTTSPTKRTAAKKTATKRSTSKKAAPRASR